MVDISDKGFVLPPEILEKIKQRGKDIMAADVERNPDKALDRNLIRKLVEMPDNEVKEVVKNAPAEIQVAKAGNMGKINKYLKGALTKLPGLGAIIGAGSVASSGDLLAATPIGPSSEIATDENIENPNSVAHTLRKAMGSVENRDNYLKDLTAPYVKEDPMSSVEALTNHIADISKRPSEDVQSNEELQKYIQDLADKNKQPPNPLLRKIMGGF